MEGHWIQVAGDLLTRRETKTPMAFYTRFLFVILAAVVAPLYSGIGPMAKITFLSVSIGFGVLLAVWVSIFAWYKPEHLLYGAETHFEKWKMAFGTEKGFATVTELQISTPNPQPPAGADH
jgi:hypothetical protein